jgi:NDP-sugar pyrophosphorylase family protein
MKAVILAAGKGTRMRELTDELPKPMLIARGKPILEHIIQGLGANGFREIFIVTGFKAEVIENHFGDGSRFGLSVQYARQMVQNGTGKAPELARAFAGPDSFLLTYGDILVRPETYGRMAARFVGGAFAGLVATTAGQDVTKGAILCFDRDFLLRRLVEKPSLAQLEELKRQELLRPGDPAWYNAGIYMFTPALFEHTGRLEKSPRGEYELTDAISSMLAAGQRVAGLQIEGPWVDVRDPEVLAALEEKAKA